MAPKRRKQLTEDLFTPLTPEIVELIEAIAAELGSYSELARTTGITSRYLRHLRKGRNSKKVQGRHKTISLRLMDRILTRVNLIHRLRDYPWYTTEELEAMGIWQELRNKNTDSTRPRTLNADSDIAD